jgi:hypothetical protein
LQALELLNDPTYVEAARRLAQLAIAEGGACDAERLTYAFRRALARKPTSSELALLLSGLKRYLSAYGAEAALAKQLITHGDSQADLDMHPALLAAYTASAGVILNLDETITLE